MNVLMLFQAATRSECLSALAAGVASCANVLRTNVSLQIGRIGENFLTAFAHVASAFVVRDLVSD